MLAAVLLLTTMQFPSSISEPGLAISSPGYQTASEGYGHILGVPYQWQEINGFCHWSALSMALQHAEAPLELHSLFAASGIGFSAGYVRYEDIAVFMPGAFFKQMEPLLILEELYGFDITVHFDPHEGFGDLYSQALTAWGLEFNEIQGWTEAMALLRTTIDTGHPIVVWTDPFYLPARDYDIARDLGLQSADTGSGHAVTVIGYNDTAETVEIMDPGVGAFGDEFGYPDDGRWHYDANYTSFNSAWRSLGYGSITIDSGTGVSDEFTSTLVSYVCDRLRGDRASYATGFENVFFWNFGSDAYRALSLDLTYEGISGILNDVTSNTEIYPLVLRSIGNSIEGFLAIQYLSYRKALDTLPALLPELDLDQFVEIGSQCLPHFDVISDNASMIEIGYAGGNSFLTQTFNRIADAYDLTGDIQNAISQNEQDLTDIQNHLLSIADTWDSAADALEAAYQGADFTVHFAIASGFVVVIVVTTVLYRRRSA
jgi:hypothetical protein